MPPSSPPLAALPAGHPCTPQCTHAPAPAGGAGGGNRPSVGGPGWSWVAPAACTPWRWQAVHPGRLPPAPLRPHLAVPSIPPAPIAAGPAARQRGQPQPAVGVRVQRQRAAVSRPAAAATISSRAAPSPRQRIAPVQQQPRAQLAHPRGRRRPARGRGPVWVDLVVDRSTAPAPAPRAVPMSVSGQGPAASAGTAGFAAGHGATRCPPPLPDAGLTKVPESTAKGHRW